LVKRARCGDVWARGWVWAWQWSRAARTHVLSGAGEDIGALVARVFAEPTRHIGTTLELAGDELTGHELAAKIRRATDSAVSYARFPQALLDQNPLLRKLVEIVDAGDAVGKADVRALRGWLPGLLTFDAWLERTGAAAIRALWTCLARSRAFVS
jgi:hypothetical protein